MADMNAAIKILRQEFPTAVVGLDNDRPYAYAKLGGKMFGIIFDTEHAGDPKWARGPSAIVYFPGGILSSRNWEIVANLTREGDKIRAHWLVAKPE